MGRDSKYCSKKMIDIEGLRELRAETFRKAKDAQRDEANIGLLIMYTLKEKEVK